MRSAVQQGLVVAMILAAMLLVWLAVQDRETSARYQRLEAQIMSE